MFTTMHDGTRSIGLRDPSGLATDVLLLSPAAVAVLGLCDGVADAEVVAQAASRKLGQAIHAAHVDELLARLDRAFFLETPRFHAHAAAKLAVFRAQPLRLPSHAGTSYPQDPRTLAAELDAALAAARRRAPPSPTPGAHTVIAPHIDFARGTPVYADAYLAFAAAASERRPELIVVFGTDHVGHDEPFTLTAKHYQTPLGATTTDTALVAALARRLGPSLFAEEFHHASEHSLEFQMIWLRHLLGADLPPVLPVLCGALAPCGPRSAAAAGRAAAPFLDALNELIADRAVLVVAGADFAHVGPRFGDRPLAAAIRARVEAADRAALLAFTAGDSLGFWDAIGADHDRYRVCGLAPVFASLELGRRRGGGARGQLLAYAQCPADELDTSWVTIAAADVA
jgi:hypothetical protein